MISFGEISDEYFQKNLQLWIKEYAEEKVKAGVWIEQGSLERSRDEFTRLLPNGKNSENQHIKGILNENGNIVGSIWFGVYLNLEPYGAFIWDFRIDEEFRGKGYGKDALVELNTLLKQMKIDKVTLHVFAHNTVAVNLYKKMGYEVTDLMMSKEIE